MRAGHENKAWHLSQWNGHKTEGSYIADYLHSFALFLQEDFITVSTFGDILYENFLFDIPKIMDICALYGGETSTNTPLLRKMLENIFSKQPK